MEESLDEESRKATQMLAGKAVRIVWRHRPTELVVEFTDGSRLFVDARAEKIEISIT